jgi:hypothetical protein
LFNFKTGKTLGLFLCEDLYDDISRAATEVIAELKNPGKYYHNAIDPFMLTDIEI